MTNNQTLCSNAATGLTVGLTGFDSNTGRAHCIQRPEVGNACLPNEMAKGLRIVPSGANFRMVLICAPIQQFTCGLPNSNANHEDYSFRTLNATYFDSDVYPISPGGPPAAPRCVFTSESPSTYSATFSSAANMRSGTSPNVCPPRYNVTGGCSATGVNQVSGGSCTCCTSQDFYGVCNGWSTHTWNHTTYSVTTTPSNTLYPGNESVTCTLNETTPANPACFTCPFGQTAFSSPSIRGTMHFQPTCALEIPSTPLEIDAVGL